MSWEKILKKRTFASRNFQHLKQVLLGIVEKMPSGKKFRTSALKEEFLEAAKKESTAENLGYNKGLIAFSRSRVDAWLKGTGARVINSSGLVLPDRDYKNNTYVIRKGKKMSSYAKQIIDRIMDENEKTVEDVLELIQQDIEERGKGSLDNLTGKQSVPTRNEIQDYLSKNYARRNTKINDEFGSRRITYYYKE
jgi:hypothetical protein